MTAQVGDTVTFKCTASSKPPSTVIIVKIGKFLSLSLYMFPKSILTWTFILVPDWFWMTDFQLKTFRNTIWRYINVIKILICKYCKSCKQVCNFATFLCLSVQFFSLWLARIIIVLFIFDHCSSSRWWICGAAVNRRRNSAERWIPASYNDHWAGSCYTRRRWKVQLYRSERTRGG